MILVVGGTGKIGGEVIRLLAERGTPVRALVRDPFKASRLARPGVELVQGDLGRPETLAPALRGVTRVFLVTNPGPDTAPHHGAMIAASAEAGVERLVRVSVLGIGSAVPAGLFKWHAAAEEALAASGVPAVNLRPTSYMQNVLGQAESIRRAGQFFGSQGDGKLPIVDARDVAAAAVGALTRANHSTETVMITGPEPLSYGEMAAVMTRVLGRPVAYLDLPPEVYCQGLLGVGLPEWLARDLSILEDATRGTILSPSDGVTRLAGHPPRPFEEFIQDHRALLG